jgi:acyl-coenzyme A synthetase/AMP-(fatty) acid ligase
VLWTESSPHFAVAALAVLACGGVLVPLSDDLTEGKVRFVVADMRAELVITHREIGGTKTLSPDALSRCEGQTAIAFAPTLANAPALVVYTSGTTSTPKGVVHAHRMALGRAPMREGWTDLRESDVVAHAGKLNWTYAFGLCLIDTLSLGATAVVAQATRPEDWGTIVRDSKATILAGVPSFYRQLMKYGESSDFKNLRHALCAGESLSPELLSAWVVETGAPMFEALGMSECSTYVSCSPTVPPRPGSAGKPQPGRRVAILPIDVHGPKSGPLGPGEVGLLAVHKTDPGLMLGYHERPEEDARTSRGEWFCGGDLARMDPDGYVWFEGRNDELMNSFGYRVSPATSGPI